jgi:hypothetical protein
MSYPDPVSNSGIPKLRDNNNPIVRRSIARFTDGVARFYLFIYFFFNFCGWRRDCVYLVRQPRTGLSYQPWMIHDECGAISAMKIGRGNRSTCTQRKPSLVSLCPPQILLDLTWARTRTAAVGSRQQTAWAMRRLAQSIRRTGDAGLCSYLYYSAYYEYFPLLCTLPPRSDVVVQLWGGGGASLRYWYCGQMGLLY